MTRRTIRALLPLCALLFLAPQARATTGSDVRDRHAEWNAADRAAWKELNVGDAESIAATAGKRRAAEEALFSALDWWSDHPSEGDSLEPMIEASLLARREHRDIVARKGALRVLDRLPITHPDFGLLQLVVGSLAEDSRDSAAAAAAYERAAHAPRFAATDYAWMRLAQLQGARNDTAAAGAAWREVTRATPPSLRSSKARAWLAGNAVALGRHDDAVTLLQGIIGDAPKGEEGATWARSWARALDGAGRWNEARPSWGRLFEGWPGTSVARQGWSEFRDRLASRGEKMTSDEQLAGGVVLLRNGDETGGRALLDPLTTPANPATVRLDAMEKTATWLWSRKRWSDARESWAKMEKVPGIPPDRLADARLNEARCFRNSGAEPSMTALYESLAADTTRPVIAARALWEMAREYRSLGRFADCETVLGRYIDRYPIGEEIGPARTLRGLCRFIDGRYAEAGSDFTTLFGKAERAADREQAAYWRGRCLLAAGDTTGAAEVVRAGVDYGMPDNYYGFRCLDLLDRLGVADSSIRWRPTPRFNPASNPFAPSGMDSVLPRARDEFERGLALARGGFGSDAAIDLNRVAELLPDDPTILGANAALGVRLGLYTFAMQSARRALARVDTKEDEARLWRFVYALGYHDLVEPAAAAEQLDPMLVTGLIRRESLFDERAVSRADARGLMQLMLPTARAMAREFGDPAPSSDDLFRPDRSVRWGARYLKHKIDEFDGRVEVALAAYNAGEGKAKEWRDLLPTWDPDLFMEMIDWSETKDYVRVVRYHQDVYHLFYDPDGRSGGANAPVR